MVKDLNKFGKKGSNKRCPFRNQCGKICEHVGSELACTYYKYNACGDDIIEDQERIRKAMEKAKIREMEEEILAEMEESETGGRLVMLSVDKLYPHPDNPRKNLGDLTELSKSIKAKGVMQNLTVVPRAERDGTYTIIIGHRRHAAAKKAGLGELPCAIVDMSEQEQVATMLLENIQRSDLTAYEQAKGFQMMMDLGDSVKGIVEKTGFSESTVRRRLEIAKLDDKELEKASGKQITFADLDKLSKIDDIEKRNEVLKTIGTASFDYNIQRAVDDQEIAKSAPIIRQELIDAGYIEFEGSTVDYCYIATVNRHNPLENCKKYYSYLTSGEQIYFCQNSSGGSFWLYRKVEKKTNQNNASSCVDEKLEVRTRLREAFATAYHCRLKFITEISESTLKGKVAELSAFIIGKWVCNFYGNAGCSDGKMLQMLGFEENSDEKELCYRDILRGIKDSPLRSLVVWSYLEFGDSATMDCYDYTCEYENNRDLWELYNFLTALGYEMSDEERELITGESELYVKAEDGSDE